MKGSGFSSGLGWGCGQLRVEGLVSGSELRISGKWSPSGFRVQAFLAPAGWTSVHSYPVYSINS